MSRLTRQNGKSAATPKGKIADKMRRQKPRKASPKKSTPTYPFDWCLMIYLVGDNNLGDEMVRAISKVVAATPSRRIAIFAQFDGPHPTIKSRRFDLQRKKANVPFDLYSYEVDANNASTPRSIVDFVRDCVFGDPNKPSIFAGANAKYNALVLSGHGDGVQQKAFLLDESPTNVLSIPELRETLDDIRDNVLGRKLDILGIDSCLMNSLEISVEVEPSVKLLAASQGNILNAGWDISEISRNLNSNRGHSPEQVAVDIFADALKASNRSFALGNGRSADLSVLNLEKISVGQPSLLSDIDALASSLCRYFPLPAAGQKMVGPAVLTPIAQILRDAILVARTFCQRFLSDQAVDVYDFIHAVEEQLKVSNQLILDSGGAIPQAQLLGEIDSIITLCKKVRRRIKGFDEIPHSDRFVLGGIYSGSDYQFANGVTLFFPWSEISYALLQEEYEKLAFFAGHSVGKQWTKFTLGFLHHLRRSRTFRAAPPFYKAAPPFYRGSETYLEYFRKMSNFVFDPNDEGEIGSVY